MQLDTKFYIRYFRGIFSYIDQYEVSRSWHRLLVVINKGLELAQKARSLSIAQLKSLCQVWKVGYGYKIDNP
ncbi:DUF2887 domain-containing protein [Anabaena sp. FACHB-1237]|uniref:DUF2887 domain-containing protein n=1 Tax=Anabaena sp. FACHB-1237 TaxID=2692769 RepID=UPI001680460D|nr:DUF2887 domain-containing protein [Anabaena sp. FACHB-1237]MBD2139533.1 DUF2887 domain-containing protein [Anabaena sp. FACHB-1237]